MLKMSKERLDNQAQQFIDAIRKAAGLATPAPKIDAIKDVSYPLES